MNLIGGCSNSKNSPKYYGFHSVINNGFPISPTGSFRQNVPSFLENCAQPEGYNVEGMRIWCTFLVDEDNGPVCPLYTVIQECVENKNSGQPHCDHCRCSGWSHHLVSKRKYHFIIPIDNEWSKPLGNGVLDLQTHILHGLIHCNGFGHLLCINGREGGSDFIRGTEAMDIWDQICTNLHSRKISVVDTSKKGKMDLRLLYGVSQGCTWFGRWNYRFCHGSFGVTADKYHQALETLSSLQLDTVVKNLEHSSVKEMISRYRDLNPSRNLLTIKDLFSFMLQLISPIPAIDQRQEGGGTPRKFSDVATGEASSRWGLDLLHGAADLLVGVLKAENRVMSRQDVKDTALNLKVKGMANSGLINHVLRLLDNVIVGGYLVLRANNSVTGNFEYWLQETTDNPSRVDQGSEKIDQGRVDQISGRDIYKDLAYLYQRVLLDSYLETGAVRTVLDTKTFTKEWSTDDDPHDGLLLLICHPFERRESVGEQVFIPRDARLGDLKSAAEIALQDTYCRMENLKVTEIVETKDLPDDSKITFRWGAGFSVRVSGVDLSDLKNCWCGDPEDGWMVACIRCRGSQHARCSGIKESKPVPLLFMCSDCRADL